MKAISIWQPWASAVALGAKKIETRGWSTKYRGPLAIHASKRLVKSELIHYSCSNPFRGVFYGLKNNGAILYDVLPFGAIIAIADLLDCRPTESFTVAELDTPQYALQADLRHPALASSLSYTERMMGDFSLGRYGWILANVRMLNEPIHYKGSQGFFNVPDELL